MPNRSRYLRNKLSYKKVSPLTSSMVYQTIKPTLIARFKKYLATRKKSKAGAPVKYDLSKFFDVVFEQMDSSLKNSCIKRQFPSIAGSYKRYFKLLKESNIMEELFTQSTLVTRVNQLFIVDSFTVKSTNGKEGTGVNYLDRGRKGVKVTLIVNTNKVVKLIYLSPANKSEVGCLRHIVDTNEFRKSTILADRGYLSKALRDMCKAKGLKLLTEPKKTSNSRLKRKWVCKGCTARKTCTGPKRCKNNQEPQVDKFTHTLNSQEQQLLHEHRNKIEHCNGYLRRFRSINVKSVRLRSSYLFLVTIGCLLNNYMISGIPSSFI